ncbi:hypothetical protein [Streptomyces sp. NPDC002851]
MTTDLSKLTTAAEQWDAMAAKFKKLEDTYDKSVHGITLCPTWQGLSAEAANARFRITLSEYKAAQKEAKAIADLLRDAHAQFVDLRNKVKAVRDDAVKAGMRVSDQGMVQLDYSRLSPQEVRAAQHDPDLRGAESSWAERIQQAVKAVTDADDGVKIALEAVVLDSDVRDGTINGFNTQAQGDVEKYEAAHAKEIAMRINGGEEVSAAERAELQRAFRDNEHRKGFTQTFLTGMGTDGTVKLANQLNNLSRDGGKAERKQYAELREGLATTVARATEVKGNVTKMPPGSPAFKKWLASDEGKFYREWTNDLDKTGVKNFGSKTDPLYGYQSLVSLMKDSNARFDGQFLYELGDDLIQAEKDHQGMFTQVGGGHEGIKSDAIDGLMEVMSEHPDAATAFFDPKGNGEGENHVGNNHLKYLAGDSEGAPDGAVRDWPKILYATGTQEDDPTSRQGLAAALEAAATGHRPIGENEHPRLAYTHSPEQARVMNEIINVLDGGTDTEIHENLRMPIAQALGEYAPDSHEILGGLNGDYPLHAKDGFFPDEKHPGQAHMASHADSLIHVMRGLSDDPEAYGTLHKAESRFINDELNHLPKDATSTSERNTLNKAGAAMGVFTSIREDVLDDDRMDAYSDADWKSKVAYHIIGGAVTPMAIPTAGGSIVVGDALQRGVDTWAWAWGGELKEDADAEANEAVNDRFLKAREQMQLMVHGWGEERYDLKTKQGREMAEDLTEAILSGHSRGAGDAAGMLKDTPS